MVEGKCTGGRKRRKISSLKEGEKHKTELNEKLEKYMQEGSFVLGRSDVFEWRRRRRRWRICETCVGETRESF